jgi:hypothetical protein
MQIDKSDEHSKKARAPISESCEPASKAIAERRREVEKQSSPSV